MSHAFRWDESAAGAVAGAVGTVIGHPLDTIKVRLQTSAQYRGVFHCAQQIGAREGYRAFFQGMAPPLVSLTFLNTISFALFGGFSRGIAHLTGTPAPVYNRRPTSAAASAAAPPQHDQSQQWQQAVTTPAGPTGPVAPLWNSMLAGGCTGAAISVLSTPFDMVKLHAQLQRKTGARPTATPVAPAGTVAGTAMSGAGTTRLAGAATAAIVTDPSAARPRAGSYATLQRLVAAHGPSILWRGYCVNTVREFVFGVCYFGVYINAKDYLTPRLTAARAFAAQSSPSPSSGLRAEQERQRMARVDSGARSLAIVCAGSASGMSGWLVSFPLDIVKTNVQTAPDLSRRLSSWQALQQQTRAFGWFGLYRGLTPTLARAALVSSVRFSAYEFALTLFDKHFNH